MDLLIGTTSGLRHLDGSTLIGGTRINHISRFGKDWWTVDGKGRIHKNGELAGEMPDGATSICIQPTPDTVWVGADEGRLFGLSDGVITEDEFFATAPDRDTWYTPWGAPADVRSMALDADLTLYINVHVGGILRYDNTGVVPTIDVDADVHQVAAHPTRQGAIFAACAYGLASSHNGHDFEIRNEGMHASYCRAVAVLEDRVLVSASTGPSTSKGRLYRGDFFEGAFEPVTTGLPDWFDQNLNTACLIKRDGHVFAGVGDTIWVSSDDGDTWDVAAAEPFKITCLA